MLIRGDKLDARQRAQVLAAYVYRWTVENPARSSAYKCPVCKVPGGDPQGGVPCRQYHPTVPLQTDEWWLREHAFDFVKDGSRLSKRGPGYAVPAYMAAQ